MSMRHVFVATAALGLAACSLALDADKKGCSKNTDCGAPYECKANLCQPKTDCASDDECRALGDGAYANTYCDNKTCRAADCSPAAPDCEDGEVCNTTTFRCVPTAEATCDAADDCTPYAGLPACVSGRCSDAECEKAEDCPGSSPTLACNDGVCSDAIWGCAGEPDDRPPAMSATATFKVAVVDLIQRKRIDDLTISLCSAIDTTCAAPLREPDIDYDANGLVTVTGLPQDTPLHFKFTAPGFIDSDFYVQKIARDVTEEPGGVQLLPDGLFGALASQLGVEADHTVTATFSALFQDCQNPSRPAANVTLVIEDQPEDVTIYYVRDGNTPDVALDKTTVIGAAGALNVPPGRQITLKGYVGEELVSSYAITPYANRMTYVNMYPRVYTAQ